MPYQVYTDVDSKPEQREHIEECADYALGEKVIEYVTARLPKTDHIFGEWGEKQAGAGEFDYTRLREETNEPTNEPPEGAT